MNGRVLIAEDSAAMRQIILRVVMKCGMSDVVEAVDGAEALRLFGEQDFDLVLTDWIMPNLDGLQLVKAIRRAGSEAPIIMITTEANEASVRRAIRAGVTDYLAKPFEAEVLREKINRFACAAANDE
jgi:two-component system chemotaxis response regulator CheY